MCGIYGIYKKSGSVNAEAVNACRDKLSHRGPDDSGTWISPDQKLALAHRRLAINDLSSLGHQPMMSGYDRYTIVFNGEIYNFQELRDELEQAGYEFVSGTDTEVILQAYGLWGESCLDHFNGMFSFVVYDHGDNDTGPSLFFARDRVGKKPFYYYLSEECFEFGSELKVLTAGDKVSLTAINYYLALGYIPGEHCFIDGVKKLPPAHAGRLKLNSLELKIWRYWELPKNNPDEGVSGELLADEAQKLLTKSVKSRMVGDVPLGVLLSGGLDSSIIAAIASKESDKQIKTFTLSIPGSELDEASYAQIVADHLSTDHHVLELSTPSLDDLEEIAYLIDEPLADSSLIPSYLISKLTREYVTIVLGGDGGDELFGGYSDYPLAFKMDDKFGWVPQKVMQVVGWLAGYLPAGIKGRNRLASLQGGPFEQQIWGTPYFDVALRRKIFRPEQLKQLGRNLDAPERFLKDLYNTGTDEVDSMTRSHFGSILPDDFLVKVDRSSMAVGLESRTPFLDHRLVEFSFSKIPSIWKVKNNQTRRVERIIGKRLLPDELDTKRKQGFSIPLDDWLKNDNCRLLRSYLTYLPDYIDRKEVESLVAGLKRGRTNGARLYALLVLGISMKNLEVGHCRSD